MPERGHEPHDIAQRETEEKFRIFLKELLVFTTNTGHRITTIVTFETLLKAAKEAVAKQDIDMIVMGTKGMTGATTLLFGTNAIKLMEGVTECPVLAVPEHLEIKPPKEIVFPTDYKGSYKKRDLVYMINIAEKHKSNICVLHIKKSEQLTRNQIEGKALLESILTNVDHSFHELNTLGVQDGITGFIESRNSDMIAFTNQKHSFFSNLFSKPLVKKLGYYSKVPVLVLKHRK